MIQIGFPVLTLCYSRYISSNSLISVSSAFYVGDKSDSTNSSDLLTNQNREFSFSVFYANYNVLFSEYILVVMHMLNYVHVWGFFPFYLMGQNVPDCDPLQN